MSIFRDSANPSEPPAPETKRALGRVLRVVAWSVLGLVCVVLVCVAALLASLNVDGVHHYLLGFAQQKVSSALGVPVKIEDFAVHLENLSADVYGVRVAGASPHPSPPLLAIDHVQAGVRIVSIFHRQWYLNDLRIDHPVAWILVDKQGVSNIPKLKSSGGSSNTNIFTLGIRHALVDRGAVYYNSRPSAIAADLHNLLFRASFNSRKQMYSGNLSYTDGHLKYQNYEPLAHNLDVRFNATPTAFRLLQAKLSSGASQVVLSGGVQNYDTSPVAEVKYAVTVDGGQIAALLHEPTLPTGMVRTSGSIGYRNEPGRPLFQNITVNGDLSIPQMRVATAQARAVVDEIAGHYALANGDARLSNFRAKVLGGELTAQGTIKNLGGDTHSAFHATVHEISLAALQRTLASSAAMRTVAVSGALNATAGASWGKTLSDLVAHADATVDGKLTKAGSPQGAQLVSASTSNGAGNPAPIPVDAAVHALYSNGNETLKLANSYLRTSQTNLNFNGTVGKRSSLAVHLQANDLSELAAMANAFSSSATTTKPLELAGTALFQGTVQGSTLAPRVTGQFAAQNLRVNGTSWKVVRAHVEASPNGVSLQQADLEPASQGRISVNASAGLRDWKFSPASHFQVELAASRIQVGEFARLSSQPMPVSGTLSANFQASGSELNPEGGGSVTLSSLTAYQQPIQSAKVNFSAAGNQVKADLLVQALSGSLNAHVTVQPKEKTYSAQLTSSGIEIGQLQLLKGRNISTSGVLALNASGQGSFSNPQLNAAVEIPSLNVGQQSLTGIKLQMRLANHVADAALESTALNTSIQAKAKVNLSGDYRVDASLDTSVIQFAPLLALYSSGTAPDLSGQAQIHATLQGPLKEKKLLQAQVTIPVLHVAYGALQLGAASPIQADYQNQTFDLQPAEIRGTDTDLHLQAHVPVGSEAPMSLVVNGSVDLKIAQLFDPQVRSSGQIKINIDSHGAIAQGELGGEIDLINANFTPADLPVGLQNGNGVLKLSTNRVSISKFEGEVGGGTVTASGGVDYRPNLRFDLGMTAKGVRILYPQGLRENVDANLRFNGSTTDAVLGGTVDLANLSFTPGFDLTSFIGNLSNGVETPPSQGFSQELKLNIAIHSTNNIDLVSRTLSVNGSANVQVRGTAAEPVVLGRVNLTGGDMIFNGDRFVLTGGTVQFVNPTRTEPVLNVTLTTTIQQYDINLRFDGPVDQMRSEYSSNPSLPPADIIHLLAFGQTSEATANNPTPTNQTAESLVASQVSSEVTSRIAKVAGISQLSINPVLAGNSEQGPPGAQITIQQRVTGNLFITFTTNVATTQDQIIQGQYQISPRVAISATRDPNGGFAVDTLIKKSW
jgi:translocation and assembly module TamB